MLQYKTIALIATTIVAGSLTALNGPKPKVKAPTEASVRKLVNYKVNAEQSKLTWLAKKVTGEHSGTINVTSGSLALDNKVLKGGSFELDTKTIAVTDLTDKETNAKLLGHLKSADFFAVDKFDKATFNITSAQSTGAGTYNVKGKLTIKGITNEITFPATVKQEDNKVTANAKIIIDRTKYDIKFRSKSFFENLGDKTIYDDFELNVQLVANN
ncbi:YceI family protein [Pedobacter sp. UBA5917]|jgi:polyisoprenoid-binding protein YceI|uniref:YceI family protein n=1 Tax=Pedobacter sp. UBA5917 TaxID=1947061 RepID=UPI0025D20DB2|nr:YceI family protein [Pedobacter sp. UBA5917]